MPDPEGSAPAPRFPLSPVLLRWVPVAVLVALPSILIMPILFSGKMLYGSDVVCGFYYSRGEIAEAFRAGRLPVWDPHSMAGFPQLAAIYHAVFYPPMWLCAVLGAGTFWTLSVWSHLILSGIFARRWVRDGLRLGPGAALAGGVVFMLSGYAVSHVHEGHMNYTWAHPWVAAVFWRLERHLAGPSLKRGVLLSLVLAALVLSGIPQCAFMAGLAVAARLLHFVLAGGPERRMRLKSSALALGWFALGLLFCAPQLLPTLELVRHGQRVAISNFEFVTSFSAAPSDLVTMIAPGFYGDGEAVPRWGRGYLWESSAFVGVSGLFLAALGIGSRHPQRFLWAGLALAGLVLALGPHTPVFRVFYHLVPGAGLFRGPARYVLLFTLSATALAAMGVERLVKGDDALRRHALGIAGLALALCLIAGGIGMTMDSWWAGFVDRAAVAFKAEQGVDAPAGPEFRASSRALAGHSLGWAAICCAGVAGGLFLLRGSAARGPGVAAALGLLLTGELGLHGSRHFVAHPMDDMAWPPEFVSAVRNHPQYPFRIATVTMPQADAIGKCQIAGLDHVGGFDPMMLRRYTELCNVARGKAASDLVVLMVLARPGPLFDLLGARLWIVPGPMQTPPGWKAVGQLPSGFVYENPLALPRAFLVGRSVNLVDGDERLKFMTGPGFDARRMVVLERDSGGLPDGGDPADGKVQLAAMEPGHYALRTECGTDAYLVVSEAWYPGWTVEVDGVRSELLRADHLIQAVRLPAGKHDVRFSYRPTSLLTGLVIAAAAALIPLALVVIRKRRA